MTERPIPFSGPMVRAILAGTKTQTRRVVKPVGDDNGFVLQDYGRGWWPYRSDDGESPMKGDRELPHRCPYGATGDRLWVREAWRVGTKWDSTKPSDLAPRRMTVEFEAGGYGCKGIDDSGWAFHDAPVLERPEWVGKLRPGMFMPRWASRLTLEVTEIRVERLQDISEADARAEGYELGAPPCIDDPRRWYRYLWEQINGAGSWDANPWVWMVGFKKLEV